MQIRSAADVNELRRMLAAGQISEQDLSSMPISGSFNAPPQNALADMLNPQTDSYNPDTMRGDAIPMNSMRNNETGKMTYFAPQGQGFSDQPYPQQPQGMPQQAPQQPLMRVFGAGNGSTVELKPEPARAVPLDYTRGQIDVPGVGKGYYGRDGNAYVMNPDGSKTKVLLGYDQAGSQALNNQDMLRRKTEQEILQSQETVAASQQARNQKEGIPGMGTPQSVLEKQFGKAPEGQRWTETGKLENIPGGSGKPMTEFQGKSEAFGTRAANAHEILNAVGADGKVQPGLIKRGADAVPLIGGALGMAANFTQSAAQQQVEQAQRDFLNATLRQESGANINQNEFDNARLQYFPQPGDTPEQVAQKKRNRELVVSSFGDSAGPGKDKVLQAGEKARAIFDAKRAISMGANPDAVKQRLARMGITEGL